jgi:NAD+ kinase
VSTGAGTEEFRATVGLLTNERNPAALEASRRLATWLEGQNVRVLARETVTEPLHEGGISEDTCCTASDLEIAAADFVVVFGGDGTLLAAARLVAAYGTPLLGIHLGHFGFITEAAPEDLIPAVEAALNGDCKIEERLMLWGEITRADADFDTPPEYLLAMNDIVTSSTAVRMVHVRTRIGEEMLATYAADGVIVASPTGSTGYSLSAGGPLVHPAAPVLIVTPICPHTLNARTMIVPDTEKVRLTIEGQTRDSVVVSVDGQIDIPLHPGDTVTVHRAPFNVKLLNVGGPNFYQKIRSRWHYGERVSR